MKLVLEIEESDDLQRLEAILKLLRPYLSHIQSSATLPEEHSASNQEPHLIEQEGVWVAQVVATGDLETALADLRAQRTVHIMQAK